MLPPYHARPAMGRRIIIIIIIINIIVTIIIIIVGIIIVIIIIIIRRPLWGERRCEVAHSTFARRSQG